MKRILLEILGGLTVLVLLASFHHQIAKLKIQNQEVATLRTMVEDAIANASSRAADASSMRAQIIAQIESRLAQKLTDLEQRMSEASLGSKEAEELKAALKAARGEAALTVSDKPPDPKRIVLR